MSIFNNTFTGGPGEELAKDYLVERGFLFIEFNFRIDPGELDLIMKKRRILYFIEVKTRHGTQFGYSESSVTKEKLSNMKRTISTYLQWNIRYAYQK